MEIADNLKKELIKLEDFEAINIVKPGFINFKLNHRFLIKFLREAINKKKLISDDIGKIKKKENVAILQSKRWNEILGKMILEGDEKNLSEEFILKVFKAIHQESINHQETILKNNQ